MQLQEHIQHFPALKNTLAYAASNIPWYRARFASVSLRPEALEEPAHLGRIPLLTRDDLRSGFPDAFLPPGLEIAPALKRGELRVVRSTTSTDRVEWLADLGRERATLDAAISEHPTLKKLIGARGLRRGTYFPIPSAGIICVRDLAAMGLRIDDRFDPPLLRLMPPEDPTAPRRSEIEKLFLEIESHGVEWLDVYGTYLAIATQAAIDEGLPIPSVNLITAGLPTFSERHRRLIEEAWGCPVIGHYGPPELGAFALYECPHRSLHVGDGYYCEVLRDGEPAAPGEIGELVVTSLEHRVPLIRYATGDLVETSTASRCDCGSSRAFVKAYAGRTDEIIFTERDRITAHRLDAVLSPIAGVEQYQVLQERDGRVDVRVLPRPDAAREAIAEGMRNEMSRSFGLAPTIDFRRIQAHALTFEFPLVVSDRMGR